MHREDDDTEGESVELVQLATVLYNAGRFAEARECLEKALPIVVASGFRYREAVVVSNLASIVIQHGELGRGRRLIARGLELCVDLEDIEGVATALNVLGDVHRRVGDFDEAETHLRKSVETAPASGFDVVVSDSLVSLALIATEQARHDEALTLVDDAIARGRRATSALAVARGLVGRGYVLLARGQVEEAGESLHEGLVEAQRLGLAYLLVEAEALLARVAVIRGDLDEARTLAGRVLDSLARPDLLGALEPGEIYRACWQALIDCGDPRADAALDAGRAYLDDMAARIGDDELRDSFLHRVPAHVSLAR